MDIRKIEYFIEVAEQMNVSKAAERLHISHQALSKQIGLLEQTMGARLLNRSATGVSLTAAGARVYEIFKPLLRGLYDGYQEALHFIDQSRSVLRVGYFSGLSYSRVIAPVLRHLEQQEPQLRINFQAMDVGAVHTLLDQGGIDLAIYPALQEQDRDTFTCLPLYRSPIYIVVSDRHPWYQNQKITEEELAGGSLLIYENRPTEGEKALLPSLRVGRRIPVKNFDTYMGILRQGKAFGIMGDSYSRREGNFKRFSLPESCGSEFLVVATYRRTHALRDTLKTLENLCMEATKA